MKKTILSAFLIFACISSAFAVVSTTSNKVIYSTDGVTKTWDYTFPIISASDIHVYVIDSNGTQSEITTNFHVNTSAKQVTYPDAGDALSSGSKVILLRSVPLTQSLVMTTQGPFPATSLNLAHDKLTMLSQQMQEQINRSILGSVDQLSSITFPSPIDGYSLVWSGGTLVNSDLRGPQGPTGATGPAGAGSGDVLGPATNTDLYVPQWNGANTKTLKNGLAVGTAASNLVQLTAAAKLPAVDGSLLTSVVVTSDANLPTITTAGKVNVSAISGLSSTYGSPVAKLNNTVYLAANDGEVTAWNVSSGSVLTGSITDSGGSIITTMIQADNGVSSNLAPISFTVAKGEYWKVTGAATVIWRKTGI